jgi:colicin import membrane protein
MNEFIDTSSSSIGRPTDITDEKIIDAGVALIKANRNVTGFALRKIVGGGDPKRLKDVWDRHNISQSVTNAEPIAELPVEVAETLAALTKALVDKVNALAVDLNDKTVKAQERRVADVLRAAGEQQAQAERELADASQAVDELETMLAEEQGRSKELEMRLSDSQAVSQAQAIEIAELRVRLESVEANAVIVNKKHVDELTQSAMTINKMEEAHNAIVAERDQLKTELARIQAKAEAAEESHQQRCSSVEKELAKVSERLKAEEAKAAKLQTENNTFDLQTQKLHISLDASESKAAELKAECAELRKTIGDREREAGALAGELKAVTAENKELKTIKKG